MSDKRSLTPERRRQLAAEHALGVLTGDERLAAITLSRDDAEFRRDLARWRGRFAGWLDEVAEIEPAPRAWPTIERRIGQAGAAPNVVSLKRSRNIWRGFAAAATAVAASLAMILVMRPEPAVQTIPAAQPAPLVATLASDQSGDRLVATWDPAKRSLIVAAAAGMGPTPGKDHELWVIPAGGKPMSVGVMRAARMRMTLPPPLANEFRSGVTLAVSVEPSGGSPTGLPTGPVIAAGELQQT